MMQRTITCHNHNHVSPAACLFLFELREVNVVYWHTHLSRDLLYVVHREAVGEVGKNIGPPCQTSWVQILAPLLTSRVTYSETLSRLPDP